MDRSEEFPKEFDRISPQIDPDSKLGRQFEIDRDLPCYWVNVINQPSKMKNNFMALLLPDGYNNMAMYIPWSKQWVLKFPNA